MKLVLALFLVGGASLFAGSVHLLNDSPYRLRAVIRGADGSYLGETIVQGGNLATWSDASGQIGAPPINKDNNWRSQTPYTVIWYCMSGDDYSINTTVGTGATVTAQSGDGARICKSKKSPRVPSSGELDEDHAPDALLEQ